MKSTLSAIGCGKFKITVFLQFQFKYIYATCSVLMWEAVVALSIKNQTFLFVFKVAAKEIM